MGTFTVTGLLNQVTGNFPSRRAISISGKFDITHSRLHELVERAASRLVAAGINPGDVVALTFPNTVEVWSLFSIMSRCHHIACLSDKKMIENINS